MKWFSRILGGGAAILAASVAVVASPSPPVAAGGWVVVSLDERPQIVAGEPTEVGLTVLRHGVTPESSDDMQLVVSGRHGELERFAVTPEGAAGHHVATITLDTGEYTWELLGTFMPYDLGTLDVGGPPSAASWRWDIAQWGGLGAAVALGGLAGGAALHRRTRRAAPAAA